MFSYFIRKTLACLFSLFVIASLTFFLMKIVPGDPFTEEQSLRDDVHEALRQQHGLHLPWYTQYYHYFSQALKGDLGTSFKYPGRAVSSIIQEGFANSAVLGLLAFSFSLIFGIVFGVFSAFHSNQWQDRYILFLTTTGIAIPSFLLAVLLQYVFAIYFPVFPLARWGSLAHTILPSLALAAAPMAFITRLTRSGLIDILQSDYFKLARVKGLPTMLLIFRHALRNALLPVLSYLGPLLANVLVGSFVIEKIFSIPGLGQWLINSVANRDYPLIMGLTLFYSTILLTSVLIVDLLYGVVDPRIRLIKREN